MKQFLDFLKYDCDSGVFTWVVSPSSRAPVGSVAGRLQSLGYRQIKLRGARVYAHRLAWFFATGKQPEYEIDHINGERDDNRFCNLRDVPRRINVQNQHKTRKKAGLLGAAKDKNGRWKTSVTTDGVVFRQSGFATEIEANAAYLAQKRIRHEGFAL